MKTYFTSHNFRFNLFSANIKVFIATVYIKDVKDRILAILYSYFMAKCNYSYN